VWGSLRPFQSLRAFQGLRPFQALRAFQGAGESGVGVDGSRKDAKALSCVGWERGSEGERERLGEGRGSVDVKWHFSIAKN